MPHSRSDIRNTLTMPPLAWAIAFSCLLHTTLLLLVKWPAAFTPPNPQQRLTVSLAPRHSIPHKVTQALSKQVENKVLHKDKHLAETIFSSEISIRNSVAMPQANQSLDMGQLLSQARDYAKLFQNATPELEVFGDYYGTYNGSDNGTFYVHLDQSLHATGSGQSNQYGDNFVIAGSASNDGIIQMTGTGIAGEAKFTGRINLQTRQVSGEWQLTGLGRGLFFGKHE